jgi:hypothetical protein
LNDAAAAAAAAAVSGDIEESGHFVSKPIPYSARMMDLDQLKQQVNDIVRDEEQSEAALSDGEDDDREEDEIKLKGFITRVSRTAERQQCGQKLQQQMLTVLRRVLCLSARTAHDAGWKARIPHRPRRQCEYTADNSHPVAAAWKRAGAD